MEKNLAQRIRHRTNVMHIYCKLCLLMNKKKMPKVRKVAELIEKTPVYKMLYFNRGW